MSESDLAKRAAERVGLVLKDKWRIDHLIGVGGMAAVYAATHRNGKRVAVKMLHPELSLDRSMRDRFQREGYVANKVGHRGAVTVDDDDVADNGAAFLVMELLEGESLERRAHRKGGHLPVGESLSLIDQLLSTLEAAHTNGVVHRDLKPENLFLTLEGTLKVLDFGIARLREKTGPTTSTQEGAVMGTPAFMAPEQARGRWEEVDTQTDIWAVGATLFTLVTGKLVHEAETPNEALIAAGTEHARSVATVDATVPTCVVEIVDRALAYDKPDRWPTVGAMQKAIREAYWEIAGGGPARAALGSLPDVEPPLPINDLLAEEITNVNIAGPRMTTGPGTSKTAGGELAPGASSPKRRHLVIGALLAAGFALTGGLIATLQTPSDEQPTGSPSAGVAAAQGNVVAPPAPPSPASTASRVEQPAVPIEQLPPAGELDPAPGVQPQTSSDATPTKPKIKAKKLASSPSATATTTAPAKAVNPFRTRH